MDVCAYLDRIGFTEDPRIDLPTLRILHQRHLRTIPYENLDIQLGRFVPTDPDLAFRKLVTDRRGGWCYEMNGLFGAALTALGFDVTLVHASIEQGAASVQLSHLALVVDIGQPYLLDVGFGDGLLGPIPIREGIHRQGERQFGLEALGQGVWRFINHPSSSVRSFTFSVAPADPQIIANDSARLQKAANSPYVQNLVCQRHTAHGVSVLLGRVLCSLRSETPEVTFLQSAEAFTRALETEFGIVLPAASGLWATVCERHEVLFPASQATLIR